MKRTLLAGLVIAGYVVFRMTQLAHAGAEYVKACDTRMVETSREVKAVPFGVLAMPVEVTVMACEGNKTSAGN